MSSIVHQLTVHAPAANVREAITTETGLESFWTDQVRAEPAVGSKAWFGFGPNAETQFTFEVTAIGDDRVEWSCIDGPDEWVGTSVRWLLSPTPHGTTVRFEHRDWRTEEGALGECSYTWAQILSRLSAYVSEGTADPFFRKAG